MVRIVLLILMTASFAVPSHALAPVDVTCPSQQPVKACPDVGGGYAGILFSAETSCSGQAVIVSCGMIPNRTAAAIHPHPVASDRLEGLAGGGIERPPRALAS
ncbi:hypothetical protein VE25_14760 [Devosia geojensis]|uniref:Porin n=1 Tax=Devosia geojensis TaxID=443610 RepID=A0A0F5FQB9_9HYPH|nr:hypothetical protein VE25_14760 [Devosia geojensis]